MKDPPFTKISTRIDTVENAETGEIIKWVVVLTAYDAMDGGAKKEYEVEFSSKQAAEAARIDLLKSINVVSIDPHTGSLE